MIFIYLKVKTLYLYFDLWGYWEIFLIWLSQAPKLLYILNRCYHVCKLSIGLVNDALHYKYYFLNVNFISIANDYKYGSCFSWLNSCPKAFHVWSLEWLTFWYKAGSIQSKRASMLEWGALPFRKSVYANLVLVYGSWYHLQIFI